MIKNSDYASLVLRIGLGLFFLVFGLLKFFSIKPLSKMVYPSFYGVSSSSLIYLVGAVQIIVAILLVFGWKTSWVAIVAALMELSTVFVTFGKLVRPFSFPEGMPPNFLFFSTIPILAAVIALYLMSSKSYGIDKKMSKSEVHKS